jgi:hypothetical protein
MLFMNQVENGVDFRESVKLYDEFHETINAILRKPSHMEKV